MVAQPQLAPMVYLQVLQSPNSVSMLMEMGGIAIQIPPVDFTHYRTHNIHKSSTVHHIQAHLTFVLKHMKMMDQFVFQGLECLVEKLPVRILLHLRLDHLCHTH